MAMSCSRRGPLRYVCGQTIDPTTLICTFLESPTDLDVHPKKRFAFLTKIVEIDVAEVGTQNNEICSCGPDRRGSNPVDDNFFLFFFFNILVCKALFIASRAQFPRNRAKLTYKSVKYRHCLFLCKDSAGVHCATFAATSITVKLWFIHFWKA